MKKMISSFISLVVTFLLFITCIFAWYTHNEEVRATGIIASTASLDYEFTLSVEKDNEWTLMNTKVNLGELEPGKQVNFKIEALKIGGSSTGFKCNLDMSSKISNLLKFSEDTVYLTSDANIDIPLYSVTDNKVSVSLTDTQKTLYEVKENKLELSDFKIEDLVTIYKTDELGVIIGEAITQIECDTSSVEIGDYATVYFTIILNSTKATVEPYGWNLYAYQELSIDKFRIDALN